MCTQSRITLTVRQQCLQYLETSSLGCMEHFGLERGMPMPVPNIVFMRTREKKSRGNARRSPRGIFHTDAHFGHSTIFSDFQLPSFFHAINAHDMGARQYNRIVLLVGLQIAHVAYHHVSDFLGDVSPVSVGLGLRCYVCRESHLHSWGCLNTCKTLSQIYCNDQLKTPPLYVAYYAVNERRLVLCWY